VEDLDKDFDPDEYENKMQVWSSWFFSLN
jgi:hypothetical protein